MVEPYDEELLLGYLEDDLTLEQRERFERELIADPRLFSLVKQMGKDRAALRDLEPQQAPPELVDQVNQRLEREMLLGRPATPTVDSIRTRRFTLGRVTAISALAALVLVCGSITVMIYYNTTSLWSKPDLPLPDLVLKSMVGDNSGVEPSADPMTFFNADRVSKANSPAVAAPLTMLDTELMAGAIADDTTAKAGNGAATAVRDTDAPLIPQILDEPPPIGSLATIFPIEVRDWTFETAQGVEDPIPASMYEMRGNTPSLPVFDGLADLSPPLPHGPISADDPKVDPAAASTAEAGRIGIQIDVVTDNPDAGMVALLAYATAHDIRVISPQDPRYVGEASDNADQVVDFIQEWQAKEREKRAAEMETLAPFRQVVLPDLSAEQLSDLLAQLNMTGDRRTSTVEQFGTSSPRLEKSVQKNVVVARTPVVTTRSWWLATGRLEDARYQRHTSPAHPDWGTLISGQLPLVPSFPIFQAGIRLKVRVVYRQTPIDIYTDSAQRTEPDAAPAGTKNP